MNSRILIRNLGLGALAVGLLTFGASKLTGIYGLRLIGLTALMLAVAWLLVWPFTPADRVPSHMTRFMREFFPAIIAYTLLTVFVFGVVEETDTSVLKWLLALAPAVPIAWIVRAMLRLLLASDELEQRIQLQSIALAAATVGLASLTAGFLAAARLISGSGLLVWVLPSMFAVYGVGNWWFRRRYSAK